MSTHSNFLHRIKRRAHCAYTSVRKAPINLSVEDCALFSHEIEKDIPESHILELRDAYVLNDIIYKAPKIYRDYSIITYPSARDMAKRVLLLNRLKLLSTQTHYIKRAVWITDNWSHNYFHWFTDALPRLITLLPLEVECTILLPKSFERYSYVKESLAMLGLGRHIYFYDHTKALKVGHLLAPSHTAPIGNYYESLIKRIRESFLLPFQMNRPFRKVYISREKATKRRIQNETEVISLLKGWGFEMHYFEDYHLKRQVEIMSETKYLIGLHGAGLTNMLFMPAEGKLLELRNEEDSHNNCYFSMASALDIEYYYQVNKGDSKNTDTVNISVEIEKLHFNLDLMLREENILV